MPLPVFGAIGPIEGWSDVLLDIDPYYYASVGTALSIGLSVIGAAWGILLTGASLLGASIKVVIRFELFNLLLFSLSSILYYFEIIPLMSYYLNIIVIIILFFITILLF